MEDKGFEHPIFKIMGNQIPNNEDKENDVNGNGYIYNSMSKFTDSNSNQMRSFNNLDQMMMNQINMNLSFNDGLNLNNNNNYNLINIQKLNDNQIVSSIELIVIFISGQNSIYIITTFEERVSDLIEKYRNKSGDRDPTKKFIFNAKNLNDFLTLTCAEAGLTECANIFVVPTIDIKGAGRGVWVKEINIKFIKISKNSSNNIFNCEFFGLLKLCLLKEISSKLSEDDLKKLPEIISLIMIILKRGLIATCEDIKITIIEVLKKLEGGNIINFSDYVDEAIDKIQIDKILNLLNKDDLLEINDIGFRLSKYNKYMKFFSKNFEKALQESIFEFSIVSLIIIERENFDKFEKEREKCPNRVDKILYHGTSVEPISCILVDQFKKSVDRHYQHGKGVYFTDFLDYCWFYGGAEGNRVNKNRIPKLDDTFTLIACSVYYNEKGYRKVENYKYTPKKNEINFAYAGAHFETLTTPNFKKFVGTEYVIWDLDQICPFISAKLKRNEYCVIWRDNNFSSKPVYNNKFDKIFKNFLNERMKYIKQMAKYNIYPCETTEEALKLIDRKKYNKIILISNVGSDLGGKNFVIQARKIIGNNVIALFLAYNIAHLKWIKDFKNALFSNDPKFYEEYLECFEDRYTIQKKIEELKGKIEKHYSIKFNFDDTYLDFPNFKGEGKYSDLEFNC